MRQPALSTRRITSVHQYADKFLDPSTMFRMTKYAQHDRLYYNFTSILVLSFFIIRYWLERSFNIKVEGGVWKLECGSWSVESGVWKVKLWKVECGKWSVEGGVWKVECGSWSVESGVWKVELWVLSNLYGLYLFSLNLIIHKTVKSTINQFFAMT